MTTAGDDVLRQRDYEAYKSLLDLWSRENPIKTTKLQVLLAVNAILVTGVNIAGGFEKENWYLFLAGAVFCMVWTFSIGRTALFQTCWQIKLTEIAKRYPEDPRFQVHDDDVVRGEAPRLVRVLGSVPSKWYLLASPAIFSLVWLSVLILKVFGL